MNERRIKVINGKSGSGKTYLTRTLLHGESRYIVIDQRGEYEGQRFQDFDKMADYCAKNKTFRAIWQGGIDFYNAVFHLAFAVGPLVVVVEEADLIECDSFYREAIYRGRSPGGISIWALAQRPQLLAVDLRSQATDVYTFNSSEDTAIRWLSYFFPSEILDELPNLPPKTGYHFELTATGPAIERILLP